MIYIIDDKKSRQKDYGWDEKRLSSFSQLLMPIWDVEALNISQEKIIQDGSIILFHESFPQSDDFKKKLDDLSSNLNIAYFSGSKGARFVSNNRCMLPPDVLYINLELFINKCQENDFNFKYLAFGENYVLEEQLRNRIIDINNQNTGAEKILCNKNLFFAATSDDELEVEPPFDMLVPEKNWDIDFKEKDITDLDLDKFINDYLANKHYDSIYIPLCFGSVLSDFMGLRLAMHIRLTPTINATTPIFIYGEAKFDELKSHYCFDILKTSAVKLIKSDSASFIDAYQSTSLICDLEEDLKLIHLELPSNIGQHSLANQWGAEVLARTANIKYDIPIEIQESKKTLYFKYALLKTQLSGIYESDSEYKSKSTTFESKGKRILLIDDEANKGWEQIVRALFADAYIIDVAKGKILNFDELPKSYIKKIQEDFYDLYLLDLRLQGENEENIVQTEQFSGMDILDAIKQINPGNQVIMMTASNKAWNMKKLIDKGINGYYIKESPEQLLPEEFSQESFRYFKNNVEIAFKNVFKRDLWADYYALTEYVKGSSLDDELKDELSSQLEIYNMFMLSALNSDELGPVYLTLFQVFEIIKQYYSREIELKSDLPGNIRTIIDETGKSKINNTLFEELKLVNRARNKYVHKLNISCEVKPKSVDGIKQLFDVVEKIIKIL